MDIIGWLKSTKAKYGLFGLFVSIVFVVWWQWPDIQKRPYVAEIRQGILEWIDTISIPEADPGRFSILLLRLENDDDKESMQRTIADDLGTLEGVQVLSIGVTASLNGQDVGASEKAGHEKARKLLKESGAKVAIWGSVLTPAGKSVPRLFWTPADAESASGSRYSLAGASSRLPNIFWEDLRSVILVQVLAEAGFLSDSEERGRYIADRVTDFLPILKSLLNGDAAGWPEEIRANVLQIYAKGLVVLGEQKGDSDAVEEAIAVYREALKIRSRDTAPSDWAEIQNNMGCALAMIGRSGTYETNLEEAISAFQEALKESTREKAPMKWAKTKHNMGNALRALGDRKKDNAILNDAVDAYSEALEERTRDRLPLAWASTQNSLGNAFWTLGSREKATAMLEKAEVAYREALKEFRRERVPLSWAMVQINLGNVLWEIGKLNKSSKQLEKAVVAYREAMKEYRRDIVPLRWAKAEAGLARALRTLGRWENGSTAKLKESVIAYREAMKEITLENAPMEWAASQNGLANALLILGSREKNAARLNEAIIAYDDALKVFREAGAGQYISVVEQNIRKARAKLEALKVTP